MRTVAKTFSTAAGQFSFKAKTSSPPPSMMVSANLLCVRLESIVTGAVVRDSQPRLSAPIALAAKRPLADAKKLSRRFPLAQPRPL